MHFATRVRPWRGAPLYSVQCTVEWNSSISETVRDRTHVPIYFWLELPILWPSRILTLPPVTLCILMKYRKLLMTSFSCSASSSVMFWVLCVGGRFVVTSSGDLHIKSAQSSDGDVNYSCLTLHSLTGERRRSAPATLMVTGETEGCVHCAVRACRPGSCHQNAHWSGHVHWDKCHILWNILSRVSGPRDEKLWGLDLMIGFIGRLYYNYRWL
jgi:hypothetical protein